MTIARAIRLLLAFASLLIVVWSFYDVAHRALVKRAAEHDRPIVLTVLHWGDRAEDVIVQHEVDEYMRQNPRVKIIRINPSYDLFRPKLKTMMAAGTPPDVFYLPPDVFPELATQNLIRPLDDFIAKDKAAGAAGYLDDFWPILLEAWHYDPASGQIGKGKIYGLPKDCTTSVMYVNLDLFAKAGVKVPYDGWTWDQYAESMKKIRALSGTDVVNGRLIYGGDLELWSDSIRNILWSFGGDYWPTKSDGSPDFARVLLDQPPAQEAMDMIFRLRHRDGSVFNSTSGSDNNDLGFQQFLAGNIGCDGPVGHWKIPLLMSGVSFKWDTVPVPYKEKKLQSSQIYLTAWTMAAKTPYPDECFKLVKFLSSAEGAILQSRAGLAIPPLMSIARSKDFLDPPGMPKHNAQAFLDAMAYSRIQQLPRQAEEWSRMLAQETSRTLQMKEPGLTNMAVARSVQERWTATLTSPLAREDFKPFRWDVIVWITIAAVAGIVSGLWWKARREHLGPLDRAQERAGFLFISPWLIGFLALTLGPMVVSLLLSFTKWSAMTPMSNALSVGTANYRQMIGNDPTFYQALKVTVWYVLLAVPITQVLALAVAILMNLRIRGITIFRTIYFVPSVVSGVALAVLWRQIFNDKFGLANNLLRPILAHVGQTPPDWFGTDAHRWAIPAFVIIGLWGVGAGMIIYLAGLKGIPVSMYEAATIDGASPIRKFWNVTLPMLSPLIFYNLVMGIIASFQIFTQAIVITSGDPDNTSLFYVLKLYREAFEYHNMGYASAMAWVLFLIVLVLTLLIFRGSKNLVYYEGLKT